ncbi:MAG: carbohydrate binding family 9 domain-containing protein, partial [Acidobacteria bacterium]|nr:carbohydrate binding family 9 domain-containing protein [Acidobacteriota bacterium]
MRALLLTGWLGLASGVLADNSPPVLVIPRLSQPPVLGNFLDMNPEDGHGLVAVEGFTQRFPEDGKPSAQRSMAYLGYDDRNLYVVFVCYDTEPHEIRARLGKREEIFDDDLVALILDTFNDRRRGYLFVTNPLGIQADFLVAEGQDDDIAFDTLWHSQGKLTPQGYVVLFTIPFKSLRFYPAAGQTWGFAVGREIPHHNEQSWWPHISPSRGSTLPQVGTLQGLENISPGRNLQLIPYGFFRSFRALDTVNSPPGFVRDRADPDLGLDAKMVFKDSLVLDLALNPDFSQVESDEPQVTVNQRFEVFFPERRPFFIENSTFFKTPLNLVFTRRIADPQVGVRLTGKLGRYALAAFLADDEAPGKIVSTTDPLFDRLVGQRAYFGIVRVNRDLFEQGSVGFLATAREFEGSFNRVYGADFRLKFTPNWVLEAQAVT